MAVGAVGACEIVAPAAPGSALPRPAQRGRFPYWVGRSDRL